MGEIPPKAAHKLCNIRVENDNVAHHHRKFRLSKMRMSYLKSPQTMRGRVRLLGGDRDRSVELAKNSGFPFASFPFPSRPSRSLRVRPILASKVEGRHAALGLAYEFISGDFQNSACGSN